MAHIRVDDLQDLDDDALAAMIQDENGLLPPPPAGRLSASMGLLDRPLKPLPPLPALPQQQQQQHYAPLPQQQYYAPQSQPAPPPQLSAPLYTPQQPQPPPQQYGMPAPPQYAQQQQQQPPVYAPQRPVMQQPSRGQQQTHLSHPLPTLPPTHLFSPCLALYRGRSQPVTELRRRQLRSQQP